MRSDRTYIIRQGVLAVARDFAPAPLGLDDLAAAPSLARHHATREELHAAFCELVVYGYLATIPESNGDLAVITANGLAQINGDARRSVTIFGRYAL